MEGEGVDLDTERCDVLLLEFARDVATDEGGLDRWEGGKERPVSCGVAQRSSGRARLGRLVGGPDAQIRARDRAGGLASISVLLLTLPVPPSPIRTSLKVWSKTQSEWS